MNIYIDMHKLLSPFYYSLAYNYAAKLSLSLTCVSKIPPTMIAAPRYPQPFKDSPNTTAPKAAAQIGSVLRIYM